MKCTGDNCSAPAGTRRGESAAPDTGREEGLAPPGGDATAARAVTAEERSEAALREGEERFRLTFDQSPIAAAMVGPDLQFLRTNEVFRAFLGYTEAELAVLRFVDMAHPADRGDHMAHLERLKAGEIDQYVAEKRYVRKDGAVVWAQLSVRAPRDASGRLLCFLTTIQGITDHKQAEHLVRIQRDLGIALSSTSDLAAALEHVLDAAMQVEGVDCGGVYLVSPETGEVDLAAHRGLSEGFVAAASHYAAGSMHANVAAGESPFYMNAREPPACDDPEVAREGLLSIAAIPIRHEGRPLGCLNLGSHTRDHFPAGVRMAVESIGAQVGSTLARVRAEQGRRRSEARYRALFSSGGDAIFVHELDSDGRPGRFTEVNDVACRRLGYTREELLRMTCLDIDSPEVPLPRDLVAQLRREGRVWWETAHVAKDGHRIPVEVSARLFELDGTPTVVSIARNIADRKRAAEALYESERRLRETLESVALIAVGLDREGSITFANQYLADLVGLRRDEMVGRDWFEACLPADAREDVGRVFAAAVATGGAPAHHENDIQTVAGERRTVAWNNTVLRGPDGYVTGVISIGEDITDRRRAEEALRESEERYRALVDLSPDAIVVHSEGRFVYANDASVRLFGAGGPSRLLGTPIMDRVHPDYRAVVAERVAQPGLGHAAPWIEVGFLRLDGTPVDVEVGAIPFTYSGRPAVQVVMRDISERKRAEDAIRRNEEAEHQFQKGLKELHEATTALSAAPSFDELCRLAVQLARDRLGFDRAGLWFATEEPHVMAGAFGTNEHGELRDERGSRITVAPNSAMGMVLDRRIRHHFAEDAPLFDHRPREIARGQNAIAALWDGSEVIGCITVDNLLRRQPMAERHQEILTLYAAALGPLCTRKRAEEALSKSNRELERALSDLKEAQHHIVQQERLSALGQMASGIAHDLNNSLTPILAYSELLLRASSPRGLAAAPQYLEAMHAAAQDAQNVVRRLREFYRHREEVEVLEPVDLGRLVTDAVFLCQPRWKDQAQARGVTIEVALDLEPVPALAGNKSELREALMNLIFNAADAILQKAEGQPEARQGTVAISTRLGRDAKGGQEVHLSVADDGMGMTEEARRRCLEPFYTTKGERGTGLGLATVYGIVRRHEGRVEIESAWGRGSALILRLPVRCQPKEEPSVEASGADSRALRILVVDDEAVVRDVIRACLCLSGHTVETAVNGRDGMGKFIAGHFDLVITDRAMPEMNGDQLARAIKGIDPEKPVILLTGFGDMMGAAGEHPEGIDVILGKPFKQAALRDAVARATGRSAPSR